MEFAKNIKEKFSFYKEKDTDKMWHVDFPEKDGFLAVSFDKKKVLFLFEDYPKNFTKEEIDIFKKEYPYWANFLNSAK